MIAIRRILVTAVTLSLFAVPAFTDSPGVSARGTAPAGSIYIPNRSVTVNGVVTSGGRPVSSARVRIVGLATGSRSAATTNSSGSFSAIVGAAPANHGDDRYLVTVSARGYFPSTTTVRVQQSHFSTIGVHLSPDAGRLYGTVLSPVSAPASDAAIRLVSEATGAVARTRAGRDGSFSLATPPSHIQAPPIATKFAPHLAVCRAMRLCRFRPARQTVSWSISTTPTRIWRIWVLDQSNENRELVLATAPDRLPTHDTTFSQRRYQAVPRQVKPRGPVWPTTTHGPSRATGATASRRRPPTPVFPPEQPRSPLAPLPTRPACSSVPETL